MTQNVSVVTMVHCLMLFPAATQPKTSIKVFEQTHGKEMVHIIDECAQTFRKHSDTSCFTKVLHTNVHKETREPLDPIPSAPTIIVDPQKGPNQLKFQVPTNGKIPRDNGQEWQKQLILSNSPPIGAKNLQN